METPPSLSSMPSNKNLVVGTRRKYNGGRDISCIRATLISFNLVTGLAGVCIVAVGIMLISSTFVQSDGSLQVVPFVEVDEGNQTQILTVMLDSEDGSYNNNRGGRELTTLILLCLSFGTLMAFISFVGCFGACISSTCLLMTYVLSVVTVVIFQLSISIFAIVYREPVSNYIRDELSKTMHGYNSNNITSQTWDNFHRRFACCGVDSYSDWFSADEQVVPDSCCIDYSPDCGRTLDPTMWQKKGCLAQMQYFAFEHLHLLAFFIVIVVFLQLYGIIASTLLFYHVRAPKIPSAFKAYRYERANM